MEKFSRELNGYKRSEVNQLLKEVITQTEKLLTKIESQKQDINLLNQQINHYKDIESSLRMALDQAENMGIYIKREAKNEADQIITKARRNADYIVNDALMRSEKIRLKNDQAERNLRVLKRKLRTIVEQQLEIVDEIELLEVDE